MTAAAALAVVRQVQGLAEGPKTPELRQCIGQVVNPLLAFSDHPDSRVRLGAARALLKLSAGYPEDVAKLDLTRARSTLSRSRTAVENGDNDVETQEIIQLLTDTFRAIGDHAEVLTASPKAATAATPWAVSSTTAVCSTAAPTADAAAGGDAGTNGREAVSACGTEERGEIALKASGTDRAALLSKVVSMQGVVSVTFEGDLVIVNTRTRAVSADESFRADLLAAVQSASYDAAKGDPDGSTNGAAGVGGGAARDTAGASATQGTGANADEGANDESVLVNDDDDVEPMYLDDEEEEDTKPPARSPFVGGGASPTYSGLGGGAGSPTWSFFSQSNWMTGRKVQEFDDDPTIAARLARAKKREEEKRKEEASKIGFISSWFRR